MPSGVKDIQLLELKDTISQLNKTISTQNELISSLQKMLEERNAKDSEKDLLIANLQSQLAYLKNKVFGSTSEIRHDQLDGQLNLFGTPVGDEKPAEVIEPEVISVKGYTKERKPKATYDDKYNSVRSICKHFFTDIVGLSIKFFCVSLRHMSILQGYIVISIALLFLMLFFNAIFLLMAISINRNVRLQQENQLLSMQQQRYESLKAAIEEARQARHDLRHQLCQLAALAEEGDLEKIKAYLSGAVSRIPSLELHFCENRAADGVVGYYCALAKREQIPFSVQLDLPECLPVDEINLCLVLSNLLENALEASLRTAPARRRIELTAYLHGNSLALIQVENTYDGVIREKDGVFLSSKRKGDGVGLQSVRHIAEKSGGVSTVTYQDGLFCARVMLRG